MQAQIFVSSLGNVVSAGTAQWSVVEEMFTSCAEITLHKIYICGQNHIKAL